MPYINPELRIALEFLNPLPANAGELNYAISHLVHRYVLEKCKNGLSYQVLNETVGVLDCAKMEFYRVVVVPYEDVKRVQNGSVSSLDVPSHFKVKNGLTAEDILAALREGIGASPAVAPVQDHKLTAEPAAPPPAPVKEQEQPANSNKRRPAKAVGASPMTGVEAPANTPVARPDAPVVVPKGHAPAKVDRHVQSVWDRAGQGNGEDDADDI